MAFTLVATGTASSGVSTTVTINLPAGTQSGDLIVVYAGGDSNTFTFGGDLTTIDTSFTTFSVGNSAMAYCVRGGSAPTMNCAVASGGASFTAVAYRATAPIIYLGSSKGANASDPTASSIDIPKAGTLLCAVASGRDSAETMYVFDNQNVATTDGGTTVAPSSPLATGAWVQRWMLSTTNGTDYTVGLADALASTGGASGTFSASYSGTGGNTMIVAAFMEAGGRSQGIIIS